MNSNIQKLFITNYYKEDLLNTSNLDFIFELKFIKNKILLTNEDNIVKLILNLLNLLSLWFSLCILDLHVYAFYAYFKIVFLFMFTYRLLIRIENSLFRLILLNLFICKIECKFSGLRFRKIKIKPFS